MKFGIRKPSFKKSFAARTSWKRAVRHSLGLKAPRGWGWVTNPKKAAYNRVYNRTTFGAGDIFGGGRSSGRRAAAAGNSGDAGCAVAFIGTAVFGILAIATSFVGALAISAGVGVVALVVKSQLDRTARQQALLAEAAAARAAAEREREEAKARDARSANLRERFGPENAQRIMAGRYWLGATAEMIREALGTPSDIRERVLKTKTKVTLCYHPTSKKRFALKIHLENDVVVGWDD